MWDGKQSHKETKTHGHSPPFRGDLGGRGEEAEGWGAKFTAMGGDLTLGGEATAQHVDVLQHCTPGTCVAVRTTLTT